MTNAAPPAAPKTPVVTEQLGRVRTDDYAWMKDANWRDVLRDPKALDPAIRAHLEAENAYTAAVLAKTQALQDTMFAEMKGRVKEDDNSIPTPDGAFDYYVRYEVGAQHPLHCRKPRGAQGPETILLDEPSEAKGLAFTTCATRLRCTPCCAGTARAPICRPGCRCWPPTSATPRSTVPRTTCR